MGSILRLGPIKGVWNLPFIPCMLRLMTCSNRPRTLRRKPKRPWLMLPALLMNLELNKNTLAPKKSPNVRLSLKLLSLTNDWPRLMRLPPRVDVLPWPSLNLASGNWKLNLAAAKARLVKPSKDSRRLNVASRSFNSNKMRITRTKIACLSWLANFNKRSRPTRSRLRRLKRLLPSTWPSTARLNKSSRRPRRGPKWLEPHCLLPVLLPLACKKYASRIKKDLPIHHLQASNKGFHHLTKLLKSEVIISSCRV